MPMNKVKFELDDREFALAEKLVGAFTYFLVGTASSPGIAEASVNKVCDSLDRIANAISERNND